MNIKGKNIVIFGANGWIGKALLDFLITNNLSSKDNIIAISSSVKNIVLRNGDSIKCISIEEALKLSLKNVIFFHLSFLLKDVVAKMPLEQYIKGNEKIREDATNLIEHFKPSKIICTSSGAVYEENRKIADSIEKNPYGYLKYQDEIYFANLSKKIGCGLIIPRIFNIAGPYINKLDIYAIGNFIVQILENKKITVNANNAVVRSYIHVFDLIKILLNCANDENNDLVLFDSVNKDEIELAELAQLVLKVTNIEAGIIRSFDPSLPQNRYVGDITQQNILTDKYNIKLQTHEDCVRSVYEYIK